MREITPYLNFDGTCGEAMRFYHQCLGGELHEMSFADGAKMGGFEVAPGTEDRMMHARLVSERAVLMASDTMQGESYAPGNNVWLNIVCESDEEVDSLYPKLSEGGREIMGPHDAFWGARFAMFQDRFGIHWMLNHERQHRQEG